MKIRYYIEPLTGMSDTRVYSERRDDDGVVDQQPAVLVLSEAIEASGFKGKKETP